VTSEQLCYRSYLLRLWQTKGGGEMVWRASLEDSQTGERRGFASLDALFAFLRQQAETAQGSRGDENERDDQGVMNGTGAKLAGRQSEPTNCGPTSLIVSH
jgi:hypothetical protein